MSHKPESAQAPEAALIGPLYAAFNRRDIDAAFALFAENIDWPRASEGGRAQGKPEIRAYWTHQWQEFDPHVTPLEIRRNPDGAFTVRVHQVVRALDGTLLADAEVFHRYHFAGGLITRMDLVPSLDPASAAESVAAPAEPSAAFTRR